GRGAAVTAPVILKWCREPRSIDFSYPEVFLGGEMDFSLDFQFLIVQSQTQPFAKMNPLPGEILDRPDAVQTQTAGGVGVVEIGVDTWDSHGSQYRSCSALTVNSRSRTALHASTAACAADRVVIHVTPWATAAARIFPSSVRAP